jgi:nicotinate-nucleotide--dimethylbenzimidazole phosphoribosyltransferase
MGIGNTTPASCLVAAFTNCPVEDAVGRGAGLDDAGVAHKREVVAKALGLHKPDSLDPLGVLAALGGFEIAGLVGAALRAAQLRVPVVIDGFISTAAALAASRIAPGLEKFLIAAHRSAEPGHIAALEALGHEPLLQLDMRLGEGTGAALAMTLVEAATRVLDEMATFDSAGVSDREDREVAP